MRVKISGAELEIMEYLWEKKEDSTFADILDYFNTVKRKQWCRQTLNTYLLRLRKKGLLEQVKGKTKSFYIPTISHAEYEQKCAEEILEEAYGGGLVNFIAALTGKESITELEKEELIEYIFKQG